MLRIIGYIIGIVVLAVAGILAVAAFQPDSFRIERSAVIDAPPEKIEAILTDFRRAKEWSPWEELDPNLKRTIGGAETGVGATYAWSGNNDVGAGRQEQCAAWHRAMRPEFPPLIEPLPVRRLASLDPGLAQDGVAEGPQ